jgi:pteridine reductase
VVVLSGNRICPSGFLKINKKLNMAKVALITGSGLRVGREIARHLAKEGWDIALHFRSSSREIIDLKGDLASLFPEQLFHIFKADFENLDSTSELINNVIEQFGKIDLLVNNASLFEPSTLKATTTELMIRQMKVNCFSPFILMRDYANIAVNGQIINIADTGITNNSGNYLAYSLSKKALWELTKMAALELAPNFRVNAIAPGAILPPAGEDQSYLESVAFKTPMKVPSDIFSLLKSVDYIIENKYLKGQLIFCDGGAHLL